MPFLVGMCLFGRYMSTRDAGEQRSLLRVISTILQLTRQEVAAVEIRIAELEKTMASCWLIPSEYIVYIGMKFDPFVGEDAKREMRRSYCNVNRVVGPTLVAANIQNLRHREENQESALLRLSIHWYWRN